MPTQIYKNKEGTRVPGTTTIIGTSLGWNKNQLMWWAWAQGRDGKDFRDTSKKACDAGTLAHAMCEAKIRDVELSEVIDEAYTKETYTLAEKAFSAFNTWAEMSRLEILESEVPLVSEEFQFGGTIDAIGIVNNQTCLIDFKNL